MKFLLVILSILTIQSSYADSKTDSCVASLQKKFKSEAARSSDWGYEGLSSLEKLEAKEMITDAFGEDEEGNRSLMLSLVNDNNVNFYLLRWNAPSNSGATVIAADKKTCRVIADILYSSEE